MLRFFSVLGAVLPSVSPCRSKSNKRLIRFASVFFFSSVSLCASATVTSENKKPGLFNLVFYHWYSERDLNPHGHYCPLDFKSNVSTNSTIRAHLLVVFFLSERRDLNPRPSPWQGDALPLSYFRNIF